MHAFIIKQFTMIIITEICGTTDESCPHSSRLSLQTFRNVPLLMRRNNRHSGPHDPGFFPANFFPVISQVLLVIQPDGCYDGAIGIDNIDRIQSPSQANFQNGEVKIRL